MAALVSYTSSAWAKEYVPYDDVAVMAPESLQEPLEAQGEVLPASAYAPGTDYGVGTSNISLFGPMASKLGHGEHYVYWRDSQYEYKMAYGQSLLFDGSRFLGDSVQIITYTTHSGYSGQATLTCVDEVDFRLDPGDYLVWSDLGHYPALYERGVVDYVHAAAVGVAVLFLYIVLCRLFGAGRK